MFTSIHNKKDEAKSLVDQLALPGVDLNPPSPIVTIELSKIE